MEHLLFEARMALLEAQYVLFLTRRGGGWGRALRSAEQEFLAALDRVWAVQCMLNPSLS